MSIAKTVVEFVESRPSVKDAVVMGIVNYSGLARMISAERSIKKKAAIIAALRRYKWAADKATNQAKILELIRKSRIETKNRICVAIIEKNVHRQSMLEFQRQVKEKGIRIHQVEGTETITIIADEEALHIVRSLLKKKIIKTISGLAEIIIKSPPELESVRGVTAFLLSKVASRNINIIETLSCWTDTILVVSEQDMPAAVDALKIS